MARYIKIMKYELRFKLGICKSITNLNFIWMFPIFSRAVREVNQYHACNWLIVIDLKYVSWGILLYKFINTPSFSHKRSSSWYITKRMFAFSCFLVVMMNLDWTTIPYTAVCFSLWLIGLSWCGRIIDSTLILNAIWNQNGNQIFNVSFS